MRERRSFLLSLALLASAIGACHPAPKPPPAPAGPSRSELAAGLARTYASFGETELRGDACAVYLAPCGDAFARRAGFDPASSRVENPRAFAPNPDPPRLPGWDTLPADPGRAHVVFAALAAAASYEAAFRTCERDFPRVAQRRAELAERFAGEAAQLASLPDRYERLGRLLALRGELRRGGVEPVGALYHVEIAIHRAFVDAGVEWVWHAQEQRAPDARDLRPSLSLDDELDLHCIALGEPTWQDAEVVPAGVVEPLITEARRAELDQRVAAALDLSRVLPPPQTITLVDATGPAAAPGLRVTLDRTAFGAPLTVKTIRRDGAGAVIELTGALDQKNARHDCKPGPKIEEVRPDGEVRYEEVCKVGDVRDEVRVTLRLPALPARPELAPGDQLVAMGTLATRSSRSSPGGARTVRKHELELSDAVLVEAWRERLLLANYFFQ